MSLASPPFVGAGRLSPTLGAGRVSPMRGLGCPSSEEAGGVWACSSAMLLFFRSGRGERCQDDTATGADDAAMTVMGSNRWASSVMIHW